MARHRKPKDHEHQKGVRCSRCRPLSKAEVARVAPPPPAKPQAGPTVTDIQRFAYLNRLNVQRVQAAQQRTQRRGNK
jgi:hypothetical protein